MKIINTFFNSLHIIFTFGFQISPIKGWRVKNLIIFICLNILTPLYPQLSQKVNLVQTDISYETLNGSIDLTATDIVVIGLVPELSTPLESSELSFIVENNLHSDLVINRDHQFYFVKLKTGDSLDSVISFLSKIDNVAFVSPLYIDPADNDQFFFFTNELILLPNDSKNISDVADYYSNIGFNTIDYSTELDKKILIKNDKIKYYNPQTFNNLIDRESLEQVFLNSYAIGKMLQNPPEEEPLFQYLWYLNNTGLNAPISFSGNYSPVAGSDVNVLNAWKIATGNDIIIAVLDDGFDLTHPDISFDVENGWDFWGLNADPSPGDSMLDAHGTAVASLISSPVDMDGMLSVAYNSKVVPIRVSHTIEILGEKVYLFAHDYVMWEAFNYAASLSNIINCSWKTPLIAYQLTNIVINTLVSENLCFIVASSGNDNSGIENDNNYIAWPASNSYVLAIGGSDYRDVHVDYSNAGPDLFCVSPTGFGGYESNFDLSGTTEILSGDIQGNYGYNSSSAYWYSENYYLFNGTSASSPIAASVLALMLEKDKFGVTFDQLQDILKSSTIKIGTDPNTLYDENGHSNIYGYGRLDAYLAVQNILAYDDNEDPQIYSTSPISGSIVSGITQLNCTSGDNREIRQLQILIDNNIFIDTLHLGNSSNINYNWNTTSLFDGAHTVKYVIWDYAGNKDSTEYQVIVNNSNNLITVLSPNGGESWRNENTYSIEWSTAPGYQDLFKIKLKKGAAIVQTIAQNISSTSYDWSINSVEVASNYKIIVTSSDETIIDESDNYFSILESVEGHDLGLINLVLQDEWLTPGQDLDFEFDVRNYGIYTENSYLLKYQLKDLGGNIIAEETENGPTIAPGQILPKFNRSLSLNSGLTQAFYEFRVKILLDIDYAQGNNEQSRSVYIGSSNPFTTYEYINDGDILIKNIPQSLGNYSIELLELDPNTAKVELTRNGGGFNETRYISKNHTEFFDASQYLLEYKGYFSATEGAFIYGNPTTEVSFSPKQIEIEKGSTGTILVTSNENDPTPTINLFVNPGDDGNLVSDWGFYAYTTTPPYNNVILDISVPLNEQTGEYDFWVKLDADGEFIQKLKVMVVEPLPDFIYTYDKSQLTFAPGIEDQITLNFQPINGFSENVVLVEEDMPLGVSTEFSDNNFQIPQSITVLYSVDSNFVNYGYYDTKIIMSSATRTKELNVRLNIVDASNNFITIDSLKYADSDDVTDSLLIYYTSTFNLGPTAITQNWQYKSDTTWTSILPAQILNNSPKPQGSSNILWDIQDNPPIYSSSALFKMNQKAGFDFLTNLGTFSFNNNRDYSGIFIEDYVMYLVDIYESPVRVRKYDMLNNFASLGSNIVSGVTFDEHIELTKCYNRWYLFSYADNTLWVFDANFNAITTRIMDEDVKSIFEMNEVLYSYYANATSNITQFNELNSSGQNTGNSISTFNFYQGHYSFFDGSNLWLGDGTELWKYSSDFQSSTYYTYGTNSDFAYVYNDTLYSTRENDVIHRYSFYDPNSFFAESSEFILNNTHRPVIAKIPPQNLNEDTTLIGAIDLTNYITDGDTPFNQLELNIVNNNYQNCQVEFNSSNPNFLDIIPSSNWNGNFIFTLQVNDGYNLSQSNVIVNVSAINDSPVISNIPDITFDEDEYFLIDLDDYVLDVDNSDEELVWDVSVLESGSGPISSTNIALEDSYPTESSTIKANENQSSISLSNQIVFDHSKNNKSLKIYIENQIENLITDSLIVEIDDTSHIANIYGTSNFFSYGIEIIFSVSDPEALNDSDTTLITILPANDKPLNFTRINPADSIEVDSLEILFSWTKSEDIDSDTLYYLLSINTTDLDTTISITDTTFVFDFTGLLDTSLIHFEISWIVLATDGELATIPENGEGLFKIIPVPQYFAEATYISLPGVTNSSVDWGDYDNDGDLDLLLSGLSDPDRITKLYKNLGDGTFNEVTSLPFIPVEYSSVQWGDYDNDNDLDILISGSSVTGVVSKIYQNNGTDNFTLITTNITGINYGSADWGDYNNDGNLDVLLTGYAEGWVDTAVVYRNNGLGNFEIGSSLISVNSSDAEWGDYDNDGDLDILISGDHDLTETEITKLFQNEGNGNFTESVNLVGLRNSSTAMGDYDSDGYLDFVVAGYADGIGYKTSLYENDQLGGFEELTQIPFIGVTGGSLAWGDYDNDGDLDIFLTGASDAFWHAELYENTNNINFELTSNTNFPGISSGGASAWGDFDNDDDLDLMVTGNSDSGYVSKVYENKIAISNTAPTVPTNLNSVVSQNEVILNWDRSSDAETPQNGLTYNVMVGSTSWGCDIVAPMADLNTGYRKIVRRGNAELNNFYILKNLSPGVYYWRVQAVDNNFAGSDFSIIDSFSVDVLLEANLKVYLEGNFETDSMNTLLNIQNYIPLAQPFNNDPWYYGGSETISNVPLNIVDWVLVELRSSLTSVSGRRAGLIRSDGIITDLDGLSPLEFTSVQTGDYYVAVYTRNHISIMTASAISLSANSDLYDFTTSDSKSYGNNSMIDLGNGVFGLFAGDASKDGQIDADDRAATWNQRNIVGYNQEDVTMDGQIDADDRVITWNNRNIVSQVPQTVTAKPVVKEEIKKDNN